MEKKRQGNREAAGEVFLSSNPLYHYFFGIGDGKVELLKLLALSMTQVRRRPPSPSASSLAPVAPH
jgi:hypothetical protein